MSRTKSSLARKGSNGSTGSNSSTGSNGHVAKSASAASSASSAVHKIPEIDFKKLYETDGYLRSYEGEISRRFSEFTKTVQQINEREGGLDRFSSSYNRYGVQVKNNSIYWLEWIPGAEAVYLTGKFDERKFGSRSSLWKKVSNQKQLDFVSAH